MCVNVTNYGKLWIFSSLAFSRLSRGGGKKILNRSGRDLLSFLDSSLFICCFFSGRRLKINWMIYDSLIVWQFVSPKNALIVLLAI